LHSLIYRNIKAISINLYLGEELVVTHVGRGIDEVGTLQVDIEVNGEVPVVQPEASVYIEPFEGMYAVFKGHSKLLSGLPFVGLGNVDNTLESPHILGVVMLETRAGIAQSV
jgi:hypothetical protein